MRIVVTGSEGYIGANLCKALRSEERTTHAVLGLDKLNDGGDLIWDDVKTRIKSFKPDWIIHLAAIPSILACEIDKPQATIDNVKTAEIISDIAASINCPVMFSSSQAAKEPKSSHYAWCKNESEMLLNEMNTGFILRFSNVYGGCKYVEKKNSVMAQFVKAYQSNTPLSINGNGDQGRDFLHMNDLSKVMMDLMEIEPTKMYTVDVGTGIPTSILTVAEMFHSSYVLNPDSRSVGLESNYADITLLEKLIGYYPEPKMEKWISGIINA